MNDFDAFALKITYTYKYYLIYLVLITQWLLQICIFFLEYLDTFGFTSSAAVCLDTRLCCFICSNMCYNYL